MTKTFSEPLALWFPELNSLQLAKLREIIKEAEQEAYKKGYIDGQLDKGFKV